MMAGTLAHLTQALVAYGNHVPVTDLCPTVVPEAAQLVTSDPYAFCMAACLDRGARSEIIWTIPYDIRTLVGHLDPRRLYALSLRGWASLIQDLPRRPRYTNDAPRTLYELTHLVVDRYGGNAARIWEGRRAAEVIRTFHSIYGVGPGIANMAALLIERVFRVRFPDHWSIDIKPDTHTVRVLYRLGISNDRTEEAAIAAARRMNPEFPGIVDAALWHLGRTRCFAVAPQCQGCPVERFCAKREV
jgi:endonuclease III